MAKKPVKKAELFILFAVMSPSEIVKLFPEYKSCTRKYYMQYKRARKTVMQKLTIREVSKRVIWGAEKA